MIKTTDIQPSKPWGLLLSLFVLLLVLLTLIFKYTLSLALSENNTQIALQLNAANTEAIFNDLNQMITSLATNQHHSAPTGSLKTSSDMPEKPLQNYDNKAYLSKISNKLIERIKYALLDDPLNSKLYRLAAQIYAFNNNIPKAVALMTKASSLSPHEIMAHDYMFRYSLQTNHVKAALFYLDRLFSSAPELMISYSPFMEILIRENTARSEIVRLLSLNPVWRAAFFSQVVPKIMPGSPDVISMIYEDLNKAKAPANSIELGYFINALIASKKFSDAYDTWLRFLPGDDLETLSFINNGGFDRDPSGLIFDWIFSGGKEAGAQIGNVPGEDNRRALNIEFGQGRVTFPNVYEYIALAPGAYHIQGLTKGDVSGRRGLVWSLVCVGGKALGESSQILGRMRQWQTFEFDVVVPESNCDLQKISLRHDARSPSEQIISGSIWFDDLVATRSVDDSAPSAGN